MQYRSTSCLCLWVELYKSKRSLTTLCGGRGGRQNWQACSPGRHLLQGRGRCWFCLSSPNLRGVCEEGWGLFW